MWVFVETLEDLGRLVEAFVGGECLGGYAPQARGAVLGGGGGAELALEVRVAGLGYDGDVLLRQGACGQEVPEPDLENAGDQLSLSIWGLGRGVSQMG